MSSGVQLLNRSMALAPLNSSKEVVWPRVRPLGDAALTFEFGADIHQDIHAKVMGFSAALEARRRLGALPGVIEWVAAFASVTVYFDPSFDEGGTTHEALLEMARDAVPVTQAGRAWRIPVCFEPEFAPDLLPRYQVRCTDNHLCVTLELLKRFEQWWSGMDQGGPVRTD